MAITEISKQQYDALAGGEHCLPSWPRESEQAWYCDTGNTLIGVLLHFSTTGAGAMRFAAWTPMVSSVALRWPRTYQAPFAPCRFSCQTQAAAAYGLSRKWHSLAVSRNLFGLA